MSKSNTLEVVCPKLLQNQIKNLILLRRAADDKDELAVSVCDLLMKQIDRTVNTLTSITTDAEPVLAVQPDDSDDDSKCESMLQVGDDETAGDALKRECFSMLQKLLWIPPLPSLELEVNRVNRLFAEWEWMREQSKDETECEYSDDDMDNPNYETECEYSDSEDESDD